MGQSSTPFLPKPIGKLMGQANMAYVTKQYDDAIVLYKEVVRQAPQAHEAYGILSIIYQELGDAKKSLNYSLIHLHLSGGDNESWRVLGDQAVSLKLFNEAIYCYTKAIKRNKNDLNACWKRSLLFYEHRHFKRLTDSYAFILSRLPFQPFITRLLVHFHLIANEPLRAIQALEDSLLLAPSMPTVAKLQHDWLFFHLRTLMRLYRYIGDHQRVVHATPNIVLWMRKMKSARVELSSQPRSVRTPLHENRNQHGDDSEHEPEDIQSASTIHYDFSIADNCDLLASINTLRSPIDTILDPSRDQDKIFGYKDSVASEVDTALLPFVESGSESDDIVAHPFEHVQDWFDWMPIDLQGYFITSAMYCGLTQPSLFLYTSLKANADPVIWNGLGIEMGKLYIEMNHLEEAIQFFMLLTHHVSVRMAHAHPTHVVTNAELTRSHMAKS